MANGKIRFGKQAGGELALVIPDGATNTEVIVPESGELATKQYVDDSAVNLTGNQTVAGTKTFSSDIVGNVTGNAGTATKLQTARTINGVAFDGSSDITISNTTAVNLTGNETIAGIKTFSSSPVVPTPTTDFQVATKQYVDSKNLNINSLSDKPAPSDTDNFALQEVGGGLKKVSYKNLIKFNLNDIAVKTALNASGTAPIYACRAWVNFNGTGTVAIRASGNVSSITDNGVGDYRVNFTIAMLDSNYSLSGICKAVASGAFDGYDIVSKSTTSFTVRTVDTSTNLRDPEFADLQVFR